MQSHHQLAAAQAAYDNRAEPQLSRSEEDWLEAKTQEIAERLDRAVDANVVVTDLTDKFVEIDSAEIFRLMHLAATGQAGQLLEAVKKITSEAICELSEYQAEQALLDGVE